MNNKTKSVNVDINLLNFLYGMDENISAVADQPANSAADSSKQKVENSAIKDHRSLEALRFELDELGTHFFTQAKVCHSISQMLKELKSPDEETDVAELKRMIYSELRWLDWDNQELFADTYDGEMKWLKQLVVKAIGKRGNPKH